ncbi:MAG TPA: hypothetical protein VKR56_10440 [Candidatus Cybelea sp.]|nr:hypothetical protein [Candidatus Cybelea sp.]
MVRRFFISAFSSVVGLAASAFDPVAAAEPQRFPEPGPIVVDAATVERARRVLDAVAQGTFDRSELMPQLDAFVEPEAFVDGAVLVSAFGPPRSMFAFEKRITADQISTFFRVRFPNDVLTWVVSVDATNKITGLSLRRSLNHLIFSVVYRDVQY